MKRFLSALMAVVFVLSFSACGKSTDNSAKKDDVKVWYFNDKDTDVEKLFENVKDTVNPDEIYSSVKLSEEMLYGAYAVNNLEKDTEKLTEKMSFYDVSFDNGTFNISSVPIAVYSGSKYLPLEEERFNVITDRKVAALKFIVGDEIGTVPCTYEVNGNKIKYTALTDTTKGEKFSYELDDAVFEYEFSLKGPYLTLKNGKDSLTLTAFSFTENNKSEDSTSMYGYSKEKSPLIDNLDYFSSQQDSIINYAALSDGSYYKDSAYKITDDGRFTVYLSYEDEDGNLQEITKQFAYIVQCTGSAFFNSFGVILFDGDKTYYYNEDITDREARILKKDGIDTEKLDSEKLKEIADKKSDLYDDLIEEFKENEISVQIDRKTGEIALDSTVLFGGDSAELTDDGKKFLNKFVKAYTSVIYQEKYDGFISKTMVEGHIAPVSGTTYEGGLPLSKKRAENVRKYCLSKNTGADTKKLADNLETVGYSQSRPVYDNNGNVDMDACRRVSFRFIVNIDG